MKLRKPLHHLPLICTLRESLLKVLKNNLPCRHLLQFSLLKGNNLGADRPERTRNGVDFQQVTFALQWMQQMVSGMPKNKPYCIDFHVSTNFRNAINIK